MRSDNAPEYAAYAMQCICEMFGIVNLVVAVGNPRAMGPCETQHNRISKVVTEALSKGELRNSINLDILSATCSIGTNRISDNAPEYAGYAMHSGKAANVNEPYRLQLYHHNQHMLYPRHHHKFSCKHPKHHSVYGQGHPKHHLWPAQTHPKHHNDAWGCFGAPPHPSDRVRWTLNG